MNKLGYTIRVSTIEVSVNTNFSSRHSFILLYLVAIYHNYCSPVLLAQIAIGWTVPNKDVLQAGLPVQIGCSLKIGWPMAFDVMILMVVLLYDIDN